MVRGYSKNTFSPDPGKTVKSLTLKADGSTLNA